MSTATAAPPAKKPLSPRKRAQRIRWVQYGILAAILIAVAVSADWAQISSVFFRGDLITATLTQGLGNAMKNTIVYTIGAFVFGLVFGTVLALMRLSTVGPYRWIATAYIEFFRGLPAIVVLMAFGLLPLAFPGLIIPFDPYGTVWVALGIVAAAYMAETIRAGIQAVPKGQIEAARSLGLGDAALVARRLETAGRLRRDSDPENRAAPGLPDHHSAADQRGHPADQGLLPGLHPRFIR